MLKEKTYLFKDMKDGDELSKIVEAVKSKRADFCLIEGEKPQDINVILSDNSEGFESKSLKASWHKMVENEIAQFHEIDILSEIKLALIQEIAFEVYSLSKEKSSVHLYSLNVLEKDEQLNYEIVLKV